MEYGISITNGNLDKEVASGSLISRLEVNGKVFFLIFVGESDEGSLFVGVLRDGRMGTFVG